MAITRAKKEETVKKLKDKIAKSKALLFARFHGLSVAKTSDLRRKFRAEDADFTVAKKSLIKIALKESDKEFAGELDGEVGMAAGYGDELALFKTASDFAKKEKEAFAVLGGYFDGKFIDASTAKALGAIPSREALLSQLMSVLQGNIRKFMYVIDQLKAKGQTH